MKTYLLTIAGLVVLTLAVLFVAKSFWFTETAAVPEKADTKSLSRTQPRNQQSKTSQQKAQQAVKPAEAPRRLGIAELEKLNLQPDSDKMPIVQSQHDRILNNRFRGLQVVGKQSSRQHLNTIQIEQMREMLQKQEDMNQKQDNFIEKRASLQHLNAPQSNEAKDLRYKLLSRHTSRYNLTGTETGQYSGSSQPGEKAMQIMRELRAQSELQQSTVDFQIPHQYPKEMKTNRGIELFHKWYQKRQDNAPDNKELSR